MRYAARAASIRRRSRAPPHPARSTAPRPSGNARCSAPALPGVPRSDPHCLGRPVPGMAFEAEPRRQRPPCAADRARRRDLRHRRQCAIPPPVAPSAAAASSWRGSGLTNSETRMPAAPSRAMSGRSVLSWPAASSPPSVVTSCRRSGTMQHACGRSRQAIATISVGRRQLHIERCRSARSRSMSSSRMWRRSSRRCAVMPSAPASSATAPAPPDRDARRRARCAGSRRDRRSRPAAAPSCRLPPPLCDRVRHADRGDQARRIGDARPAMSNAVPWSGEVRTIGSPSVTLTPCVHVERLERDQRLVVVHADRRIIARAGGVGKHACRAARGRRRRCPRRATPRSRAR